MEDFWWTQAVYGLQSPPSQLDKCNTIVNSVLGELVGRYFVNKVFSEQAKSIALDLVNRIVTVFNQVRSSLTFFCFKYSIANSPI